MSEVKVICEETRYVGNDRYLAGATYAMPAERAGKYAQSFRPVTDSDRVEAEAAWGARLEQMQEEMDTRLLLQNVDPSLLKAAVVALQQQVLQSAQAKAATKAAA